MLGLTVLLLVTHSLSVVNGEFDLMAFTLGQDQHLQLTDATTIQYTKEITNHNVHDLASSVFTCRTPGLFKFQVYSLTRSNTDLFLDLYKNDGIVASLWAHTPQDFAAAGNAIILDLAAGDTIQVKSHTNHSVSVYGTTNEIYTTFSGVQLGSYQTGPGVQLAAFSVALDQHETVAGGAPVLYGKVYVDTEYGFNPSSGTYVAPNGGIYVFHIFALSRQDQVLWLELFHNTDYVCSIYGLTVSERADAGNTAILHLKAGDKVQVRARADKNNTLFGQPDQIYATFSGCELYPENTLTTTRDGPKSYFSVGLASGYLVKGGNRVIFDRIFTDLGGDYNHLTGEYTATEFGTYEFNYHALAEKSAALSLDLYHNYKYVNSLFCHTPGDYGAAGNSAVLELDRGDVVYVRAKGDNNLYGDWDNVYCTFSGALLHSNSAKQPPVVGK